MNWYKTLFKTSAEIIGYHATKAEFDSFDILFAEDKLGMQWGEGLGHNKIYFAKEKKSANPQAGEERTKIITVKLNIQKPFDGKKYQQILKQYINTGMTRYDAVDKLDDEIKSAGYDAINDNWQIAVFDPRSIDIVNAEYI